MSQIVNFAIPTRLNDQIKKTVKQKGFANRAEFFRFAVMYTLGNVSPTKTLDEVIKEARADYQTGNYQTFRSAKGLLKNLKS